MVPRDALAMSPKDQLVERAAIHVTSVDGRPHIEPTQNVRSRSSPVDGLAVLDDPWLRIVKKWAAPQPRRVDMSAAHRAFASARPTLLLDLNSIAAAASSEVKRTT
jgi:hypothetical protein